MAINHQIHAIFNLQKFVRMSRILLPLYIELLQKQSLTTDEARKLERIIDLYSGFNVSPEISIDLINSSIIDYIKTLFSFSRSQLKIKDSFVYHQFITESDFLIDRWNRQMLN